MEVIAQKEKIFKHYLELPIEVRTMMINEMETDDRYQLTMCSKQCYRETRNSRNFVDGLRLYACYMNILKIDIVYGKLGTGFMLRFEEENTSGKKHMIHHDLKNRELGKTELASSTDLQQYGIEHFKGLLDLYKNTIKKLVVFGDNIEIDIGSLRNLEELKVKGLFDMPQMFAMLRRPLKGLMVDGRESSRNLVDCEQIYEVKKSLTLYHVEFNSEQFQKLSASNVTIPIGSLTENDISHFIQSWQNGTLGRQIGCYRWQIFGSNFDVRRLLNLLGFDDFKQFTFKLFQTWSFGGEIDFEHSNEEMETFGRMRFTTYEIRFDVLAKSDE